MDLQHFKQKSKSLNRFKYIKLSLYIFLLGIVFIPLSILIDVYQLVFVFFVLFLITIFMLFFGLLYMLRKQKELEKFVFEEYYLPYLNTKGFQYDITYKESKTDFIDEELKEHFKPKYQTNPSQTITFDISSDVARIIGLQYSVTRSTGNGTSTTYFFSGLVFQILEQDKNFQSLLNKFGDKKTELIKTAKATYLSFEGHKYARIFTKLNEKGLSKTNEKLDLILSVCKSIEELV
jgi:hypothetical protein